MRKKPTIALVLGGGGARGLAHLGVIQAFDEAGIRPDLVVGSSAGALAGAAYAANADIADTLEQVQAVFGCGQPGVRGIRRFIRAGTDNGKENHFLGRFLRSWGKEIFLGFAMFRKSVMSEEDLEESVSAFVPDIDIEEAAIPLVVSAVDLITGKAVALSKGSMVKSVMASCAVPGFMPPIEYNDMTLIDGGAATNIPAEMARAAGADIVIGVDVSACLCRPPLLNDGIDIMGRAVEIMNAHLNECNARQSDLLIVPDVKMFGWTDFHCFREIISEGQKAAGAVCRELTGGGRFAKRGLRHESASHSVQGADRHGPERIYRNQAAGPGVGGCIA